MPSTWETPLPSRVLDVHIDGEDTVLKNSHDLEEAYTILTHCWGNNGTMITASRNFASWIKGIIIWYAASSFQDAVTVTRLLGIPYLWINFLCIIQGQELAQDSQDESRKIWNIIQCLRYYWCFASWRQLAGVLQPERQRWPNICWRTPFCPTPSAPLEEYIQSVCPGVAWLVIARAPAPNSLQRKSCYGNVKPARGNQSLMSMTIPRTLDIFWYQARTKWNVF